MRLYPSRIFFILATMALTGVFFIAAVSAGRAIVISRHVFYNDILFGIDAQRNIQILTEPGNRDADMARSNVHPLFPILFKPWAPLIQRLHITPAISGIIVNAAAGAGALLLVAWYFRRRRLPRADAWNLTFLLASSATWVCMSAIPGTYIFSLNFIILSFILAHWALARPDPQMSPAGRRGREALWLVVGIVNYGITVTNGMISVLAYGFSRRGRPGWIRAAVYGVLIIALGVALSILAGSFLNFWGERQWLVNDELRGGTPQHMTLIALVTPTLWSFLVPAPTLHSLLVNGRPAPISGILHWNFHGLEWLLLGLCAALILAGIYGLFADRDPVSRRLTAGLAAALAFHTIMHRFYYHAYEGVFFFTPHSIFLVVALLAPLAARFERWTPPARRGVRVFLFLLALALALRNYHYFYMLRQILPLPQ